MAVADRWEAVGGAGAYAFNDWHAAMAYVGAGRTEALHFLQDTAMRAASGVRDNTMPVSDIGLALIRAVQAFGSGDYAKATRTIRPVRDIAHRFGGSHAQRDLIDLTLIEAAIRGSDAPLASALAAERAATRPHSPLALGFVSKAGALRQHTV
jgi:hypothetical protein